MFLAAILHNTETGRFHPVMLNHMPIPEAPHTYISAGHHPEGFESVHMAREHIQGLSVRAIDSGEIIQWDGKKIDLTVSLSAAALANLKSPRTTADRLLPRAAL